MNKNSTRLAKTIFISGFGVLFGYIINFLLTPYITKHIGIEAYGFVSIAKTAVSYAGMITVALTAFVVRFISVSYHEGNLKEAQAYYSSSINASVVLSTSIFIIALFVIYKLEVILNIPSNLVSSVKILFIIVFLNFVVSTVTNPLSTAAYISNRLDITGLVKIIAYICEAITMIILFISFKPSVWFVGIGSLSASIVTLISSWLMTKRLTPELKFKRSLVSLAKVKDMMKNGIWNSLNSLGNILNSGLDLIISNLMLSNIATGQIAVAKTIGTMFSTLYQVVFQPFQPKLLKTYASKNIDEFIKELTKAMKICGYFSNVAFAGFVALGRLYFQLWLPEQDSNMLHILTTITVLGSVTEGVMHPVFYVSTLTLKNRIPCWITISGGLLNVLSMYFLLKYTSMGSFAVVGTTAIIMISINLFFNPMYAAKCLGIKPSIFYKVIIRHLISTGLMIVAFSIIADIIKVSGWLGLILSAFLMCIVGVIIHIFAVGSKKEITDIVRNKIKSLG